MEHHDCEPPTEERLVQAPRTWECPECHDLWEVRPLASVEPARSYTFLPEGGVGYPGPTPAEWVRVGRVTSD
jgi:hypothetical protein